VSYLVLQAQVHSRQSPDEASVVIASSCDGSAL